MKVRKFNKNMGLMLSIMVLVGILTFQAGVAEAHCDSLDGPVVKAAKQALETKDVNVILPYLPESGEAELKEVFEKTLVVREEGEEARELADYYFFETAVRLHRAGENAAYTGLKPAGQDYGPALPAAEEVVKTDSVDELKELMAELVTESVEERFQEMKAIKANATGDSVAAARKRIKAELEFEIYIHKLYNKMNIGHSHQNNINNHQAKYTVEEKQAKEESSRGFFGWLGSFFYY